VIKVLIRNKFGKFCQVYEGNNPTKALNIQKAIKKDQPASQVIITGGKNDIQKKRTQDKARGERL